MRIVFIVGVALMACLLCLSAGVRTSEAGITSITAIDIPNRLDTINEGAVGTRKMLFFDIQSDAAVTLTQLGFWCEGTNLKSLGNLMPDGYERGIKSIELRFADSQSNPGNIAFSGALVINEKYSPNPENNRIYVFSQIVYGSTSQVFLNILPGHNYFVLQYNFDAPGGQPAGATKTLAGEKYSTRLDYVKTTTNATIIANIMGPTVTVLGTIVGTTFEQDSQIYFARDQVGIPVDPVVISAVRMTTSGTAATWTDFLIRGEGTGNETRVSRLTVYEDTTGDLAFTPPVVGMPSDTLIATVDTPFSADDGQAYHILATPFTIPIDSVRLFFFCYEFDPNAPDPVNNGFRITIVNFGGAFRITTPDNFSTLISPTLRLFPLPPGINVQTGLQNPDTQYIYTTPALTERYVAAQYKITALKMNVTITDFTFFYTVTSTGKANTLYSLELWLDANNSGLGSIDSTDVQLATITHNSILANLTKFQFHLTQGLQITESSFANIILVATFTDQANAAYGFTLFGDGVIGNFTFVRFYPTPAPLYSNWLLFITTPPVSPTPTPTPTPTVTPVDPGAVDGGNTNVGSQGNDTGYNIPGSLYGNPGGGCFVATAAFGSMASSEVEMLCELRDISCAAPQAMGIVGLYYSVGPGVADRAKLSPGTQAFVRFHLMPLIRLAE